MNHLEPQVLPRVQHGCIDTVTHSDTFVMPSGLPAGWGVVVLCRTCWCGVHPTRYLPVPKPSQTLKIDIWTSPHGLKQLAVLQV